MNTPKICAECKFCSQSSYASVCHSPHNKPNYVLDVVTGARKYETCEIERAYLPMSPIHEFARMLFPNMFIKRCGPEGKYFEKKELYTRDRSVYDTPIYNELVRNVKIT